MWRKHYCWSFLQCLYIFIYISSISLFQFNLWGITWLTVCLIAVKAWCLPTFSVFWTPENIILFGLTRLHILTHLVVFISSVHLRQWIWRLKFSSFERHDPYRQRCAYNIYTRISQTNKQTDIHRKKNKNIEKRRKALHFVGIHADNPKAGVRWRDSFGILCFSVSILT